MTCIVGIVGKNHIYMGGDSAGVGGLSLHIRADEKVFVKGNMIFGITGSFRMGNLLRFKLLIPEHPTGMDNYEYMCTSFIDAIRDCFKAGGFAQRKDEVEEMDGAFVVGYKGQLYEIESDYQVGMLRVNYHAVGCGRDLATGAMFASQASKLPERQRIVTALEAAEQFSAGVRGPFVIKKLRIKNGDGEPTEE